MDFGISPVTLSFLNLFPQFPGILIAPNSTLQFPASVRLHVSTWALATVLPHLLGMHWDKSSIMWNLSRVWFSSFKSQISSFCRLLLFSSAFSLNIKIFYLGFILAFSRKVSPIEFIPSLLEPEPECTEF